MNKKKNIDLEKNKILAIVWLEKFLEYFTYDTENTTNLSSVNYSADRLPVMNSDLGLEDDSKKEESKVEKNSETDLSITSNKSLSRTVFNDLFPETLNCITYYVNSENPDVLGMIKNINLILQNLVIKHVKNSTDFNKILFRLRKSFEKGKVKTREIVIEWFAMLFSHFSNNLMSSEDDILVNMIQSINFKDSKLTESVLQLLCQMVGKYPQFISEIIRTLLKRLKREKGIEIEYINNIIDIMCLHIDPIIVFSEFAKEIKKFRDCMFMGFMIETLDLILAGSDAYKKLRDILARKSDDIEK